MNGSRALFAPTYWLGGDQDYPLLPRESRGVIRLARAQFPGETEDGVRALWQRFSTMLAEGMTSLGQPVPIFMSDCLLMPDADSDGLVLLNAERPFEIPEWSAAFRELVKKNDSGLIAFARDLDSDVQIAFLKLSALLVLHFAISGQFDLVTRAAEILQVWSAHVQPRIADARKVKPLQTALKRLEPLAVAGLAHRLARSKGGTTRSDQLKAEAADRRQEVHDLYKKLLAGGIDKRNAAGIIAQRVSLSDRQVRRILKKIKQENPDIS